MFGSVRQAADLGAVGVGATIYFGSEQSRPPDPGSARAAFAEAHELGMFTVLWCYLRNPAFKTDERDYHVSADLTGQANHIGVTIEADIIKQKQPENNGGYTALKFGKTDPLVYEQLTTDHPDRPHPLAGHQLLRGPRSGSSTPAASPRAPTTCPGGAHRRDQQAGRWHWASSSGARRSSDPMADGVDCSTPSRTSSSTPQ